MLYKPFLLLSLALVVQSGESAFSQLCFPIKKVHAFFQHVSKGVESREEAKKEKTSGNYYVYVESKKSNITLNHIWIKGMPYNGQLKELIKPAISQQPQTSGTDKRIDTPDDMIPATNNKLFQVIFTALQSNQPAIPTKYSSQPLVVEVQYKNKKKYFALKEIRTVTAAAMY